MKQLWTNQEKTSQLDIRKLNFTRHQKTPNVFHSATVKPLKYLTPKKQRNKWQGVRQKIKTKKSPWQVACKITTKQNTQKGAKEVNNENKTIHHTKSTYQRCLVQMSCT